MLKNRIITLREICSFLTDCSVEYVFVGDLDTEIYGYSALNQYVEGTITWVRGEGNALELVPTAAVIENDCKISCKNSIICNNPKNVFFQLMERFYSDDNELLRELPVPQESDRYKDGNWCLGKGIVLRGDITLGKNVFIGDNVTITGKVSIGDNCVIKSGTVIGEKDIDFYYNKNGERIVMNQYGGVSVGNNVIIGPNCVINRGSLGDTTIGDDCIIDALCNISHNVIIGKCTSVIAGTIIMGSVSIGDNCYVSTSIIRNGVSIGNNTIVGMGSNVISDIDGACTIVGNPAHVVK